MVTIASVARRWDFLLAAMSFPIIGIDFLRQHGLLVDMANLRLLPGEPPSAAVCSVTGATEAPRARSYTEAVRGVSSSLAAPSTPSPGSYSPSLVVTSAAAPVLPPGTDWATALRLRFPAVFNATSSVSVVAPPQGIQHFITTIGQPSTAKFRHLDPARLEAAKAEFQAMLDEGIIRRSSSQWSSPLHMVKKKDGSWRPCGDYRHRNLQTVEDRYPLPNMADLAAPLAGCTVFSKLDLKKGYLQVPVPAGDVPKTAIITPFGLFEFVRMPFGLKNAGMTFQWLMDTLLGGLPFVFVYLDDILVASSSSAEHRRHLSQVFAILEKSGLPGPQHQRGRLQPASFKSVGYRLFSQARQRPAAEGFSRPIQLLQEVHSGGFQIDPAFDTRVAQQPSRRPPPLRWILRRWLRPSRHAATASGQLRHQFSG
jgi:hypothetical protein